MSRETVEVYADWHPMEAPLLIGQLTYRYSSRGGVALYLILRYETPMSTCVTTVFY